MNDIQTPFLIDLSDLIFDENYHQSKNTKINNHHKQNEISQKLKKKIPSLPENNILNNPNSERKTEKMENLKKPKEKSDAMLPLLTKKESKNEKQIIDSFYNQIDISASLNLLLNEKIKKIKPTTEKDLKESKEDNNFMEDFFSPLALPQNPEKEFKIINSEEKKKKIDHSKNKKGSKYHRNNQHSHKSSSNYDNRNEYRAHKKKLNSNYDADKRNNNEKSKIDKQIPKYTDIVLTNTNNNFMKVSNTNDRNRNFASLLEKDSKNLNSTDISTKSYDQNRNNHTDNLQSFQNKILYSSSQNFVNPIKDSIRYNEDCINIPLCNFSPIFFSNLKEKLNLISLQNINKNNGINHDRLNISDLTESMDVTHSFTKNYSMTNQNKNRFFTFYQKTFEDPLLQKHVFLHPGLRLSFLKAFPSSKKLISKDYLYNILNGEVKHIYEKIKDFQEKEIYYIKLQKDRDVEEIYTRVFVTEKVLKKKLNKREISAEFMQDELNISEH